MSDCNEINQDQTVAHYSRLEHVANILHDKQLLVGPVCNLADPREASMDWIELEGIGSHVDENSWRLARKIKADAGHQIRLLCTTGPTKNPSPDADRNEVANYGHTNMWAKYGDESKGFCVVLDREGLEGKFKEVAQMPQYIKPEKVEYYEWLSRVSSNVTIQFRSPIDLSRIEIFKLLNKNGMLESIYFKKSFDWIRENEHRWLLYDPKLDPIYVSIEGIVKAVVLGGKFPANQISQVKSYCKELECPCFMFEYEHPKYTLSRIR